MDAARDRQKGGPPHWGRLHEALFRHPLAVTGAARARFNVGPFERPGYADTVMSTGGADVEQSSGASFSAVFDLGDWDRSVATNAPGQSGSPASPHFADLAKLWAAGEYFPLLFSDARRWSAAADATLMLVPRVVQLPARAIDATTISTSPHTVPSDRHLGGREIPRAPWPRSGAGTRRIHYDQGGNDGGGVAPDQYLGRIAA